MKLSCTFINRHTRYFHYLHLVSVGNKAEKQLPAEKCGEKILRPMLGPCGGAQTFQPSHQPPPKQSRFATKCQGHHTRGSLSAGILACSVQQWKESPQAEEINSPRAETEVKG